MGNIKNFVGEYAYNKIKNIAVDEEKLRQALVTPKNARAVFSGLTDVEIKSLCSEISNSCSIGTVRKTTKADITEAFAKAGYDRVIFDEKTKILECKKYYEKNETICTYNNLDNRMQNYHMLVAVKKDIDKIKRSEKPERDDEYGTSILNIQIAKDGSHMSIKNRYNHTVSQPDSTLGNNLDVLYYGLQSMVLGYYGFAALNFHKQYYPNIINIDNVYLKYLTEKENVYFGEFVLDAVNGVRYADTNRYFVFSDIQTARWYRNPCVLDFKEKKAIDILQTKSGRLPLITRAMKEGEINSANKETVGDFKMIFPNAKKELLSCRKKALQYIHNHLGYDFAKPYTVTAMTGAFTAKKIEKITGSDSGVLLMYIEGGMNICEMKNGLFSIQGFNNTLKTESENICIWYTKKDFEQARKNPTVTTYIIQQDNNYIDKNVVNEYQRKMRSKSYNYSLNRCEFDASGCNVTITREELFTRLRCYKKAKRQREAANTNFAQHSKNIAEKFQILKTKMIEKMTVATSPEEYRVLSQVISYSLIWLLKDIEEFNENVRSKSFSSIESATINYDNIICSINEKIEMLDKPIDINTIS